MEFLQQIKEQFINIWRNFNKTQKITVVGGAALVFILLIFSTYYLSKTDYEPLYPNLSLEDSAMIANKLKDMKVDYKIASDGTTILVPTKLKHQLRLDITNQLPQGGVIGFESFNETRFGETDTDKRVRYLASLQGELTRTIREMDGVELAKVQLALPEPSLFIGEEKPATASVLLKLKPYTSLNANQVKSIIHFISHSVEGLAPENVTVIDNYGNLLSEDVIENQELNTTRLTATQHEIKREYEERMAKSLQSMLEKVRGPGKAVVRVSADFDFDQVETSVKEYGDSVLRSEQTKEENSESTFPGGDIVGSESNLPQLSSYQGIDNQGTSTVEKSEAIKNYEIDEMVENRKKAQGKIEQISIAVIVDGIITEDEKENLEEIVANASGMDFDRGDSVSVIGMDFDNQLYKDMQEVWEKELAAQGKKTLVTYASLALLMLAIILGVIFFMRNRNKRAGELAAYQVVKEESLESEEDLEKRQLEKKVDKIAKTQPESVAKIIRTWLTEDTR